MRAVLIVPPTLIVPPALIHLFQTVTHDPLSAVLLALLLPDMIGAWFAGRDIGDAAHLRGSSASSQA